MRDTDGTLTTFDPDVLGSSAYGINARGEIVGAYNAPTPHGYFIDKDGALTSIDVPCSRLPWTCSEGGLFTYAMGINARGDIVGVYLDTRLFRRHGFLLTKDGLAFIPTYPELETRTLGQSMPGVRSSGLISFLMGSADFYMRNNVQRLGQRSGA